jgi:hypothetical protein
MFRSRTILRRVAGKGATFKARSRDQGLSVEPRDQAVALPYFTLERMLLQNTRLPNSVLIVGRVDPLSQANPARAIQ